MFAQVRPPNAIRPSVCRVDNAAAFKSLAENDCLQDLGIRLDKALEANPNLRRSLGLDRKTRSYVVRNCSYYWWWL